MSTPPRRLETLPLLEWSNLSVQLRWAYEDAVPDTGRRRTRHDPRSSAWLLREGRGEVEESDGTRVELRPGTWTFPPPDRRWQDFSPDARLLSVNFDAKWPNGDLLFALARTVQVPAAECPRLTSAAETLAGYLRRRFPHYRTDLRLAQCSLRDYVELQALFGQWLQMAAVTLLDAGVVPRRLGPIDHRVLTAVRHLDTRPIHEPLSDESLVELTGLSVSQLNRLFGAHFGVSPKQYFEARRAEIARLSLRGSETTAKQVAYHLGFRSLSHFSVWFQKHEGCPPRTYRQRSAASAAPQRELGART